MTDVIEVTERVVEVVDVIEQGLVIQGGGGSTSWNSITGKPTFTDLATSNETDEDIEITDETKGFIRKSPNGTRWRLGVSNSGVSVWTPVVMFMVLAMTLCGAMAQPVTGIGTTTNGTVVTDNTNVLTWSNAFAFTNGADSTTRTNLFGSDIPLVTDTNNNVISGRSGALEFTNEIQIGGGAFLNGSGIFYVDANGTGVNFEESRMIGAYGSALFDWSVPNNLTLNVPLSWDNTSNAATTRTNLNLGGTNTPTFAGLTLTTLTNATGPQVVLADTNGTVTTGSVPSGAAPDGAVLTAVSGSSAFNSGLTIGTNSAVSIGTTSNSYQLNVQSSNSTWTSGILNTSTSASGEGLVVLFPNMASNTTRAIFFGGSALSSHNGFGINFVNTASGNSSNAIAFNFFGANNLLFMRANRRAGFNTSSPDAALEINSATGQNLRLTWNDSDGGATNFTDFLQQSNGVLRISNSANLIHISSVTASNVTVTTLTNATGPNLVLASTNGTLTTGSVPSGGAPEGAVLTVVSGSSAFVPRPRFFARQATNSPADVNTTQFLTNGVTLTVSNVPAGIYQLRGYIALDGGAQKEFGLLVPHNTVSPRAVFGSASTGTVIVAFNPSTNMIFATDGAAGTRIQTIFGIVATTNTGDVTLRGRATVTNSTNPYILADSFLELLPVPAP
jgi:hypothetical protein